jgi:hypothetical protein
MRRDVFGTCFSWTIDAEAESAALNERMTLKARDRMRTYPLESPRKRLSAPVARETRSFCGKSVKCQKTGCQNSYIKRIATVFVCRYWQFSLREELKSFPGCKSHQ